MQLLRIIVFLILRVISRLVIIFMPTLFWVWAITDFSTIFIIPFLSSEVRSKKSWFTGVATYFVVQFIGRVRILYGILIQWIFAWDPLCSGLLCFGFSLKLGLVPLHFWVARRFINFHYGGIFVVGAGQKVFVVASVPLFNDVPVCAYIFYWIAIASILYGPVAIFNAITVKSFLGYSSVGHTGFLVVSRHFGLHLVYVYAFIYCVRMFFLNFIFWRGNCFLVKDLGIDIPLYYKTGFIAVGLRFSGFPPFLDFCTKFVVLQLGLEAGAHLAIFAVLARSLINLLVWVWIIAIGASGLSYRLTPSGSIAQNTFNISCVTWNMFIGLGFRMLY